MCCGRCCDSCHLRVHLTVQCHWGMVLGVMVVHSLRGESGRKSEWRRGKRGRVEGRKEVRRGWKKEEEREGVWKGNEEGGIIHC